MSSRKKSGFCRATRAETKLRITKNLIYCTKVMKIIKNMAFEDFANYWKKRNRTIVRGRRRRGFRLGNRDNIRVFQSKGKIPEEMDWLKMRVRGAAMEESESLSIRAEIPSGPVEVSEGRLRRRCKISSSVHIRPEGQEEEGREEGEEERGGGGGGVEELNQVEKKS